MKTLFLLFTLSTAFLYEGNEIKETATINAIIQSTSFSITIEKIDVGYITNKQIYYIDKASNQVYITHRAMKADEQDETLNSTKVSPKVLDDLISYFVLLKEFEIKQKDEHDKLFNATNIHQFITLKNDTESMLFSDVKSEGFKKIHQIVSANQN